jgi:hypothetical protein
MDKKLFQVKVLIYVMAENESDARLAATQARFDIFECTAKKAEHLDPGWEDAIPYNSDDYRTCAEILKDRPSIVRPAAPYPVKVLRRQPPAHAAYNVNAPQELQG